MKSLGYLQRHGKGSYRRSPFESYQDDESAEVTEFCEFIMAMGVYRYDSNSEHFLMKWSDLYRAVEDEFGKNVAREYKKDIKRIWKEES